MLSSAAGPASRAILSKLFGAEPNEIADRYLKALQIYLDGLREVIAGGLIAEVQDGGAGCAAAQST